MLQRGRRGEGRREEGEGCWELRCAEGSSGLKMAASGLVGLTEAAVIEMSMKHKIPRVQLVKLKGIFHGNFESNGARNGSDIAKCLEKLNGVLPKQSIEPYLKTSLANFTGLFGKESFTNRLERSPSTDR